MPEVESKANGFLATLRTLRETLPPDRFDALVAALPRETAALVARPPLAQAWLPGHHFVSLSETALRVAYAGDPRQIVELARRAMLADLKTIYKIFIRFASAEFALGKAASIYQTYTRHNGALAVTRSGDHFADLTFSGIAFPGPAAWAYNEGAIRAVMDATGLKRADVVLISGGGPSPNATFHVTWA